MLTLRLYKSRSHGVRLSQARSHVEYDGVRIRLSLDSGSDGEDTCFESHSSCELGNLILPIEIGRIGERSVC